ATHRAAPVQRPAPSCPGRSPLRGAYSRRDELCAWSSVVAQPSAHPRLASLHRGGRAGGADARAGPPGTVAGPWRVWPALAPAAAWPLPGPRPPHTRPPPAVLAPRPGWRTATPCSLRGDADDACSDPALRLHADLHPA